MVYLFWMVISKAAHATSNDKMFFDVSLVGWGKLSNHNMGVSENSVPLNPMVDDPYPY